ncbi:MAG: hypothetical protein EXR72_00520 [Myxococcales bacterium]|nr:hypothetical protein [Myxococcales bacterium]
MPVAQSALIRCGSEEFERHQSGARDHPQYGNDAAAKVEVTALLAQFGWDGEDMGLAPSARAIEPLCQLRCAPGMLRGQWTHAFKLLKV